MMKINEYDRIVMILGFREVKIDDVNDFLNRIRRRLAPMSIQLFDADYVAGRLHLFLASLNALKAFKQGQNISGTLEVESLLYASGQRQISRAIEMVGLRPNTSKIAALIFLSSEREAREAEEETSKLIPRIRDERVLKAKDEEKIQKLIETFGITKLELETVKRNKEGIGEALTKVIIERSALLATKC